MHLDTVVERLHISGAAEALAEGWAEAEESEPRGALSFLEPDYMRRACEAADLSEEVTRAAIAAAARVAADEALRALAWYCHHRLFRTPGPRPRIREWPTLSVALDRDAGMFNALVLLSGTPHMQAVHRRRGIPRDVIRDTVHDLKLCIETEDYTREVRGRGISLRILNWLTWHWRGELYRLGRLQFVPNRFHGRLRAFRSRSSGAVAALSDPGVRYRADGQVDGAGGVHDAERAWTSDLCMDRGEFVGHPIHPTGYAIRKPMRLSADEWEPVLAPGDPVLNMHIPRGSPMDYDRCGESMRRALAFFPKHFPDKPFVAFDCYSWILDAQFQALMPRTSNLVRFQQEMYLFPIGSSGESTLSTVFGRDRGDPCTWPRKTTMQRAFARHVDKGGHFRGGGCFLMVRDFDWGSQVYRRHEAP